jgi:5'-3' exonuclease
VRNCKNSKDYKADTKHCIYGLDADLIMLALITHEPNFCILREEVFGVGKNITDPFARRAFKVHEQFEFLFVSILREYLELEFLELQYKLKFPFNIERIIDDFIFFCFFIGNDFLPNLNTLYIENGALDNIFRYYKEVLPQLDCYITHHGKIDFTKAEKIFVKLSQHEEYNLTTMLKKIVSECGDREKKKNKTIEDRQKLMSRKKLNARKQNFLFKIKNSDTAFIVNFKKDKVNKKISHYRSKYNKEMLSCDVENFSFEEDLNNYLKNELQKNIKKINNKYLGDDIAVSSDRNRNNSESNIESEANHNKPDKLMNKDTKHLSVIIGSDEEDNDGYVKKANKLADRLEIILKEVCKYHRYIMYDNYCSDICIDDIEDDDVNAVSEGNVDIEIVSSELSKEHHENQDIDKLLRSKLKDVNEAKASYYKEKLNIDLSTEKGVEEHRNVLRKYLEGLQWVLYYYYKGDKNWRWFYPYHYAPMISDFEKLKEYINYNIDDNFQDVPPYTPIQSQLFILPSTSRDLLPKCYWHLYETFPEYFPKKFNIDFNGKKMPWETIVLIPFVPETPIIEFEEKVRKLHSSNANTVRGSNCLLTLGRSALTENELKRTVHGKSYIFTLDASSNFKFMIRFRYKARV